MRTPRTFTGLDKLREVRESVIPSPSVLDDYEPGGNHYQMGDNGNANSSPEQLARYPRMTHEIGGKENSFGADRINLEHDDMLIHRR